jgi:Icc-related predicted phosphoesterase
MPGDRGGPDGRPRLVAPEELEAVSHQPAPGAGRGLRIAAMADLHFGKDSPGSFQAVFQQIARSADVLLLGGDLVDYGLPAEARAFAQEVAASVKIPILAVLGNHDHESDQAGEVRLILEDAGGIRVLDGDAVEVLGVGFAGVKGFAGGFGERGLQPWGEASIKTFVHEAVTEAVKLESALAKLRTPQRIAMMHYAPVRETVEGEPCEIFPFLGSSRLEEPLNRYGVSLAIHGHAHRGQLQGQTSQGVPVYNAAMPLLRSTWPGRAPFLLLELPRPVPA